MNRNNIIYFVFSNVARSRSFHGSSGFGVSDCSDEELVISADEFAHY